MIYWATALVIAQTVAPTVQQQAPPPLSCEAPAHAEFDFWLGNWEVFPRGSETKVADSRIEKISAGCGVLENWIPLNGPDGKSLSAFDPATGRWHQLWIGGQPGRVEFDGGLSGEAMVLTGYWGQDQSGNQRLVRMTYSVQEGGSIRQHGQASSDHGQTWTDSFDLIYRRKE